MDKAQQESQKPLSDTDIMYMREAIHLSLEGMRSGKGGPFGCVIVNTEGVIIGRGYNRVTSTNDPTAHAEVVAIREACRNIEHYQLEGCTVYTSCEPCPMCLGAIYWARPARIVYACTRADAARIDFDDDFLYKELTVSIPERKIKTIQILRNEALTIFKEWKNKPNKIEY
jgi:guanine deaminase